MRLEPLLDQFFTSKMRIFGTQTERAVGAIAFDRPLKRDPARGDPARARPGLGDQGTNPENSKRL